MTHLNESVFTVGSVWCCPETTKGIQNTLRHTIDETRRVVGQYKGKEPHEIHHSGGLGTISNQLLEKAIEASHSDRSINRGEGTVLKEPLCWRVVEYSPAFEHHLAHNGEPCGNQIRARAIISCLRPIINYTGASKIELGVVLDSEIWMRAVDLCKEKIEESVHENVTSISYEFEKSSRIPGLQMADLISGVVRHHFLNQSEKEAYDIMKKHSFEHLITRGHPNLEQFGGKKCETKGKGS
jgi:hypothetical protein